MRTRIALSMASLFLLGLFAGPLSAQEEQWLQYRSDKEPYRYGVNGYIQSMDLLPEPPAEAALPEGAGYEPVFAKWLSPMDKNGLRYVAVTRSKEGGNYDTLVMDTNGDGALSDESPVAAAVRSGSSPASPDGAYASFPMTAVSFETDEGPVMYHVQLTYSQYQDQKRLYAQANCWYEGRVKAGDAQYLVKLLDYNANGSFDDVNTDPGKADWIAISEGTEPVRHCIGRYIDLGGKYYTMKVARDGASIALAPAADVPLGEVKVSEAVSSVTLMGENGGFALKVEAGIAKAPTGAYTVYSYEMVKKTATRAYKIAGSAREKTSPLEIKAKEQVSLEIGEPLTSRLAVYEREGQYSFVENLLGRLGENVSISLEDGSRPPAPSLRIKSADGTYDKVFQFQYG